ncbi:MAG: RnfABCDGE type electron transport complex subunit B [Candidatus Margulisiibacteriota bacterium]
MNVIFISLLAMGGLGLFFAAVLGFASEKLKVIEDPRVAQVLEALPGLNCGACGYAGCHDLAEKIVAQGSLEDLRCPPGGSEVEEKIAEILGIAAAPAVKKRAVVKCGGGKALAVERAEYQGISNCTAAELVAGGSKACTYGCLGLGDCVTVCPFDAISMGEDDLPHVIEEKCTACGLCVEACPRNIIELVPCDNRVVVVCNSRDKGAVTRKVCKVGCIACMICVKAAPEGYQVADNLARVNCEKGDGVAEPAIPKCPTKCIVKL